MTCKSCQLAQRTPRSAEFTAGCMSCKARALAGIGGHLASKEAGRVLPNYRDTLERLFGADWTQGAQMVKEWALSIKRGQHEA